MSILHQWAIRWQIPLTAVQDLQRLMGTLDMPVATSGTSEASVLSELRLEASAKGVLLFRNNVGVLPNETGRPVRYGLANESAAMNRTIASSDLIGLRPNGQFIARECKAPGWRYTGTEREMAQRRFIELILARGGDACFATGRGTL